jgi:hypothetical protein
VRRRGHNPVDLADNLADTRVWFRTGQGREGGPAPKDDETLDLEAYLLPTNDSFAAALGAAGVDHRYEAYPAGGHNWYHWHDGFSRAWPEMQALFDRASVPPASFRYRSIEPRFSVWGWDVAVDRPDTEFLHLRDASATGLTLEGRGVVTVTTPPAHLPGRAFALSAYGAGTSVAPSQARADDHGRVRFVVTFEPPRPRVAEVRIAARP